MNITAFRYLITLDQCNRTLWENWSRCYEYELALTRLAACQLRHDGRLRVHNTACGASPLHTAFAQSLCDRYKTINSDIEPTERKGAWPWVPNYTFYNLFTPSPLRFDAVLCISTIEHLTGNLLGVLDNLYAQVDAGGMLFVTMDVSLNAPRNVLETWTGRVVEPPDNVMTPQNSVYRDAGHQPTGILYLEATR